MVTICMTKDLNNNKYVNPLKLELEELGHSVFEFNDKRKKTSWKGQFSKEFQDAHVILMMLTKEADADAETKSANHAIHGYYKTNSPKVLLIPIIIDLPIVSQRFSMRNLLILNKENIKNTAYYINLAILDNFKNEVLTIKEVKKVQVDETITLKWLIDHAPIKFWYITAGACISLFSLGVWFHAKIPLIFN